MFKGKSVAWKTEEFCGWLAWLLLAASPWLGLQYAAISLFSLLVIVLRRAGRTPKEV